MLRVLIGDEVIGRDAGIPRMRRIAGPTGVQSCTARTRSCQRRRSHRCGRRVWRG